MFQQQVVVSATDPCRLFSIGNTAHSTSPAASRSITSTDSPHGMIVNCRFSSIAAAAMWLLDPNSPWIATRIAARSTSSLPDSISNPEPPLDFTNILSKSS
jgi:hypothetical protein